MELPTGKNLIRQAVISDRSELETVATGVPDTRGTRCAIQLDESCGNAAGGLSKGRPGVWRRCPRRGGACAQRRRGARAGVTRAGA